MSRSHAPRVLQWADATSPVPVIELRAHDETATAASKMFASSEDPSGGGPVLSVTYATDVSSYLEDPGMSEEEADAIVSHANVTYAPEAFDLCPATDAPYQASTSFSYTGGGGLTYTADVWVPPSAYGSSFSAIVLAHGGGWWRGCHTTNAPEAAHLSGRDTYCATDCLPYPLPYHYIVVAIDYRLSCDGDDPYLAASSIQPQCGWRYDTTDTGGLDGRNVGAAIHDVETGIQEAKDHLAQSYPAVWNGKLAVVGNSAGGNLAYQALARWQTPEGTAQADALGAWSGSLQFDRIDLPGEDTTGWPWFGKPDSPQEIQYDTLCKPNENDKYLDCAGSYPDTACEVTPVGNNRYVDASAYNDFFSDTGGLPVDFVPSFFSNGGGDGNGSCAFTPDDLEYLSACRAAKMMAQGFFDAHWSPTQYDFCIIDTPHHAQTGIYAYPCHGDTSGDSVIQRMVREFHDSWGV